jgi:phenylacetate-CoA ligase
VSPQEQAAWAGVILARALHRIDLRGTRVAFFLRANSNLYEQADGFLIQLRYFDLMLPLEEAIAALNSFQPHIVVAPPLLLGMLAEARIEDRLRIHPGRLISVAEVLEPQDRQRLEASFAAPVDQIYQCTEGLLAVSCPAGALHLQEDIVAVQLEPLDSRDATRVSPVVTDLWRTTQPIIRYRLNDVLRMADRPCRCGSPFRVIEAIEGRADDICYFIDAGGALRPFFPDTVRRMILQADETILDYQAFQGGAGQLRIHLAVAPGSDFGPVARTVSEQVAAVVASYGCRPPAVSVELGLAPLTPGAKRRRVQRLWQP